MHLLALTIPGMHKTLVQKRSDTRVHALQISCDMGHRSDSVAISRDLGPLRLAAAGSFLFCTLPWSSQAMTHDALKACLVLSPTTSTSLGAQHSVQGHTSRHSRVVRSGYHPRRNVYQSEFPKQFFRSCNPFHDKKWSSRIIFQVMQFHHKILNNSRNNFPSCDLSGADGIFLVAIIRFLLLTLSIAIGIPWKCKSCFSNCALVKASFEALKCHWI